MVNIVFVSGILMKYESAFQILPVHGGTGHSRSVNFKKPWSKLFWTGLHHC